MLISQDSLAPSVLHFYQIYSLSQHSSCSKENKNETKEVDISLIDVPSMMRMKRILTTSCYCVRRAEKSRLFLL